MGKTGFTTVNIYSKGQQIILPPIEMGPIKYSIGEVFQLFRKEQETTIKEVKEIKISKLIKETCLVLETSEKIIITKRKKVPLIKGVDG
ncbi:hypothetical protein KKC45_00440, partial [Patescibacteria group bacterium]|nr:hypothetical protein [Patescibacteria group bacterium]